MSLEVKVMPGDRLKVEKTYRRDFLSDKDWVSVKSSLSSFKLPIDEECLVGWTMIDKLLYWDTQSDVMLGWEQWK